LGRCAAFGRGAFFLGSQLIGRGPFLPNEDENELGASAGGFFGRGLGLGNHAAETETAGWLHAALAHAAELAAAARLAHHLFHHFGHLGATWRARAFAHAAGLTGAGSKLIRQAASPAAATIAGGCTGTAGSISAASGKPASVAAALTELQGAGTGTALSGAGTNTIDLTTATVWHVPSWHDFMFGAGRAPGAMADGAANVELFGVPIEVAGGHGSSAIGAGGPVSLEELSMFLPAPLRGMPPVREIVVYGEADPDPAAGTAAPAPCSGSITIIFDDVAPQDTAAGKAGIGGAVIGFLGTALVALRRRG